MDSKKEFPEYDGKVESDNAAEANLDGMELTPRQWLMQNGPLLVLIIGGILAILYFKGVEKLLFYTMAGIGLGLVIFIHELGHFLAARWCDVQVQVFSIGFGPALPGCSFKWGETTYKLALFPFGGYVQVLGQVDGDETSDGSEDDPRSYRNKTVWQRMLIMSAGVIMNVMLAVVCFFFVFQIPGKQRQSAIIDSVDSGSPSFTEGLRTGAKIHEIGDVKEPFFSDLKLSVLRWYGSEMPVEFAKPGEPKKRVFMQPRRNEKLGAPVIGITAAPRLAMVKKNETMPGRVGPFYANSAASRATPPLEFGDKIVGMSDVSDPTKVTELPIDPRFPNGQYKDYFAFASRLQQLAGKEVILRLQRDEQNGGGIVDVKIPPVFHNSIGAVMAMGEITAIRKESAAAKAGVKVPEEDKKGDVILEVRLPEPDGSITVYKETPKRKAIDNAVSLTTALFAPLPIRPWLLQQSQVTEHMLDPVRLPDQMRAWAYRLQKSGIPVNEWIVHLHLQRNNPQPGKEYQYVTLPLVWDNSWIDDIVVPVSPNSPMAIPELGLAYQVKTTVKHVDLNFPFGPDEALQVGDVIKKISIVIQTDKKDEKTEDLTTQTDGPHDIDSTDWAFYHDILQKPGIAKIILTVNREGSENIEIHLVPQPVPSWPNGQVTDFGFLFSPNVQIQKADDFFTAVAYGMRDTHNQVMGVFWTLRGISTGAISPGKNVGGPVFIAAAAGQIVEADFWEFIFFLGMISINLAVINFLPIPVLDGGHMVFLLYEAIRGKPASEQIRNGATVAGLVFIATLMLAVLYLDISRFFM